MSALKVAERQAENQDTYLGREQDKAHHCPEDPIGHILRCRANMGTGQSHGDDAAQHTENGADPDHAVEAEEDGRVGGIEFDAGPLEQDAEESEEQEVGY